jgi:chaperonin cofactor prefoldin
MTATTDRNHLDLAINDLETQLRRIQSASDELYKIKNILTAAKTTGQIVTEEAAASAIAQFDAQLAQLARLTKMSGFAYEINAEATANKQIA